MRENENLNYQLKNYHTENDTLKARVQRAESSLIEFR